MIQKEGNATTAVRNACTLVDLSWITLKKTWFEKISW
jgi:hypothetical protein